MTEDAFRDFFAAYFQHVWYFAVRRTRAPADADDVTSETFAVAWRRRADIPRDGGDRLWLFGVARNVLANSRRRADRQDRLRDRMAAMNEPTPPMEYETEDPAVWQALAALTEEHRDLLLMRFWNGLEVADIATVLGIRASLVSSRLHKAKERFRGELRRRDRGAAGEVIDDSPTEMSTRP
ncbi:sigma-70 family RNA polymerase sigma factor [Actinoplanes sp. NPDC051470]|uniref:RNA polymerase sigma factor n=1 Tax=Actinoplanes sp. NPDC051470 TaxID=3157224 RepID=UPI00341B15DE